VEIIGREFIVIILLFSCYMAATIPREFDIIHTGKGYTMKGWDFSVDDVKAALVSHRMLNPTLELASNSCPWDCFFCFTEDPENPEGLKKKLAGEMTLEERLHLIDSVAELGAKSINIVGAGEPTIDVYFWQIVERIAERGIVPIVYTEGALKLTDEVFVQRLYDVGATVVLKVNSLWNKEYQNAVVNSGERRLKPLQIDYFEQRNTALEMLIDAGFNSHDPTRLAFDTIVCKENYDEIGRLHRYARDHNIFVLFVGYLTSGRSSSVIQNAVSRTELFGKFAELARIDAEEYGIVHESKFPYGGGVPCTIRGLGLHVKIRGEVYDCPGELEALGNIRMGELREYWEKTGHIRESFDGGCAPREDFWKRYELSGDERNGKINEKRFVIRSS